MATNSDVSKRFLLLYGSQTGQAQVIAELIRDRAVERGFVPNLSCLSQTEKKFHLEKEGVFVVVVSTTGDGDPPDTVAKFWRRLKKKTLPKDHLSKCSYALLGLGDTNYNSFCNMGKMLNRRLLELGATSFYEPGYADDGVGLELVVEPWIDGLWGPLESVLKEEHNGTSISEEETLQQGYNSPAAKKQAAENTGSEIHVDLGASESEKEGKSMKPVVVTGDQRQVESSNNQESETKLVHTPTLDSTVPISLQSTTVSESALCSDQTETTVGVAEVVSDLGTDVKKQLTLSSSLCDSATFSEFERRLRTCDELSEMRLTTPSIQPAFIKVELIKPSSGVVPDFPFHDIQYVVKTVTSMATVVGKRLLTREGSEKRTLEVEISLETCMEVLYQPGDAFGFVFPNPKEEVDYVLQRLGLEDQADYLMRLSIMPGTTKRNPLLPKHVPTCSVRQFFTHCANTRGIPKKTFLHLLSSYCSNDQDRRRLEELSSRQGAVNYTRLFTELHADLLDVLNAFPSCQPPLERLVEMLPRLQPRYFSAASSPLTSPGKVKIAFSVVEIPHKRMYGGRRQGLATGWFDCVSATMLPHSEVKVPIFPRLKNTFHLPMDPLQPIVMIGPGTGVTPFIGFLQHRQSQREVTECGNIGRSWLFFGCRHPDKDYIYREELKGFVSTGILTLLHVSFSRLDPQPSQEERSTLKYVQDNMRAHWKELAKWIMEDKAVVYVCGDAMNMSKDVHEALTEVIAQYLRDKGEGVHSVASAEQVVNELQETGRYLVDVWS